MGIKGGNEYMKSNTRQELDLDYRINKARLAGACKNSTHSKFKRYLLELGLIKYEKAILPLETTAEEPEEPLSGGAKIIPFPERRAIV